MGEQEFWSWLVGFRSPIDIIAHNQVNLLVQETLFYTLGVLTLIHAIRNGGRYVWLWITGIFYGIVFETVSYFVPDISNFWHAQSMVMVLGRRMPFYILFVNEAVFYLSAVAVSRLHLKMWAAAPAVGLGHIILDFPMEVTGVKFLWWTWHDTDPNIYERFYWEPLSSLYCNAAFNCTMYAVFWGMRRLLCRTKGYQADSWWRELPCSLVAALSVYPVGALQFIPIYHLLHDNYQVPTLLCLCLFVSIYGLLVWTGDRHSPASARYQNKKVWFDECLIGVILFYCTYPLLVAITTPENIRSPGIHEPTGDCKNMTPVYTVSGQILYRRSFLCTKDYDEGYYDWHCLPGGKPPKNGLDWYTQCGTPHDNFLEFILLIVGASLFGLYVFVQMLCFSGRQPVVSGKKKKVPTATLR